MQRNSDLFYKWSAEDQQLYSRCFGGNDLEEAWEVDKLSEEVEAIAAKRRLKVPFTRADFRIIVNALGKQVTMRHEIECILLCRGKKMEESQHFSYEKFLEYLVKVLPTLPSLGKPRELIEGHVESNPTPHIAAGRADPMFPPIRQTFGVRHNTVMIPEQKRLHWSQR